MKKKMSPKYVKVKDLELYQHYRNRCPPWVKLHFSLLDDPAFVALDERDRCRFTMCILLASRLGNHIPNDPIYLAKAMRLTEPVDLTPLLDSGLLLASSKRRARIAQERCKQTATHRREEKEREKRERRDGRPRSLSELIGGLQKEANEERVPIVVNKEVSSDHDEETLRRFPHLREG